MEACVSGHGQSSEDQAVNVGQGPCYVVVKDQACDRFELEMPDGEGTQENLLVTDGGDSCGVDVGVMARRGKTYERKCVFEAQ